MTKTLSYACIIALVCCSVLIMGMGSTGKDDQTIAGPQAVVDQARKAGMPVFLDAGSDHCVPCKKMVPVLDALKKKYAGRVNVVFVNVEEHKSYARELGVVMIPTQILYDSNGRETGRHVGYMSLEDAEKFIGDVLK